MGFTNAYSESISISASQILSRDNKLVFATGGTDGIVVTLYPAQNGDTLAVTVVKVDSGAGSVQVIGSNINVTLSTQNQSTSAQFTGTGWQEFSQLGSGGGGGTPGTPPLSLQAASADGSTFIGVPNSSVDPSTGDVTLGAGLTVNSIDGIYLADNSTNGAVLAQAGMNSYVGLTAGPVSSYAYVSNPNASIYVGAESSGQFYSGIGDLTLAVGNNSNKAIVIDATGAAIDNPTGTGPINLTSAGGVSITDNSSAGMRFQQSGSGGFRFAGPNSSFELDDAPDDGNGIFFLSSGPFSVSALKVDLIGAASVLDIDDTVPGVATLSTIFNSIGGYQANGVAGISGSGTSMTGVTVTNGLITAATFSA